LRQKKEKWTKTETCLRDPQSKHPAFGDKWGKNGVTREAQNGKREGGKNLGGRKGRKKRQQPKRRQSTSYPPVSTRKARGGEKKFQPRVKASLSP